MQYPWLEPFLTRFSQHYQQGCLHHATLLVGEQGVGKTALANTVITGLLCTDKQQGLTPCGHCKSCALVAANTHPDFLQLNGSETSLGVDDIRQISDFTQHSAQQGGIKAVLIPHSERMTTAAANALLKTLEEPNPQRYLFLLCEDKSRLPATVLSRCALTPMQLTNQSAIVNWLNEHASEALQYPFAPHFYTQPLKLAQWQHQQELDNIAAVYNAATELPELNNSKNLVAILTQKPDYISLFTLFISQQLVANKAQPLTFSRYQACHQLLVKFNQDTQQVLGLNLSLALTQLVQGLQQQLHA